jgi:hypothetical protein
MLRTGIAAISGGIASRMLAIPGYLRNMTKSVTRQYTIPS